MADIFQIRTGDRLPEFHATLTGEDEGPVDLTGATVRFHVRARGIDDPKVDAAAAIISPEEGTVRYSWTAEDTDTPGRYWAEFEVTFVDGRRQTFPNPGYLAVLVTEQLA